MPVRPVFTVNLGVEGVAASTPYVLVDLSDVANFPHFRSTYLNLLDLKLNCEKLAEGEFDVWVGVVTENDGTNGSVNIIHVFHLHTFWGVATSDRFVQDVDFVLGGANPDGLCCAIVGGVQRQFVGNQKMLNDALWKNDVNRVSPVGATTKVGVGDLVVYVEEVSGSGTLDFSLTALYEAHK